jgi:tripartite ATP-independent transporter DctP family solute receptor
MRRTLVLALGFVAVLAICVAGADYTMTIGHSQPETSARHKALLFFEEIVEKASEGAIDVEVFPSGQLGTEAEVMESVQLGVVQATEGGKFEVATATYLLYTLPFLFDSPEQALEVMRSEIGDRINAEAEANGYYVPACGIAGGFRQWTNNVRPITTTQEMVGLKMRTPGIDSIMRTFDAMEANRQSIAYVDVYVALKQGVCDGQENPYSNIAQMKFYEVQTYLTVSNYQVHPNPFFINLAWYESLPDELQKIVTYAARVAMIYNDTIWLAEEMEAYEVIAANLEVNVLSDEVRAAFAEKVQPVWQYYIDEGTFSQELLDSVLAHIGG